ncbi:MAG: proton-conducting transporter membrane subunit [Halioglobus sp.]
MLTGDPGQLPVIAVALPFVGALIIATLGRWPNLREAASFVTAAALLLAILPLWPVVADGGRPGMVLAEPIAGMPIALQVEPLGLLFAVIAAALWPVTILYAIGYMRGHQEQNQTRFFAFFAMAIGATLLVAFAANLFTLFLGYELLTLLTFPLVTHHGTAKARAGGMRYLGILLGTSLAFLLLAIIWTWQLSGSGEFLAGGLLAADTDTTTLTVLYLLFAFGIGKAALMPFHGWLPAAMVAPTPVSALLHAVAVVKAGVFCVLKITYYIFGLDLLQDSGASDVVAYIAGATILIAALIALRQDNLKRRLAYSTISQLSYIVLGAALATSTGMLGGGLHILAHAVAKITLFFCAGAILVAAHKTNVSELHGIGRAMPVTMTAFFVGAITLIGLPPTIGLWSKWLLGSAAIESGHFVLLLVLLVSSLLNIVYLLEIPAKAFFSTAPAAAEYNQGAVKEAPLPSVIAICLTSAACLALFFFPQPFYALLAGLS